MLSLRVKIWFFNSGSAAMLAFLLAASGSPVCFVFGAIAAAEWQVANFLCTKEKSDA